MVNSKAMLLLSPYYPDLAPYDFWFQEKQLKCKGCTYISYDSQISGYSIYIIHWLLFCNVFTVQHKQNL